MADVTDMDELRARRRAFEREHGGIRKCAAKTWDELCEERAVAAYAAGVEAAGGVRASARRAECDPHTVRDKKSGARGLAAKDPVKLGRRGIYAYCGVLMDFADSLPDDAPESRSGTDD